MAGVPSDMDSLLRNLIHGLLEEEESIEVSDGRNSDRPVTKRTKVAGISPTGTLRNVQQTKILPFDCGHAGTGTIGGECFCGAWVCSSCFSICSRCAKPICGAHRKTFQEKYFCEECLPKEKAKARWERIKARFRTKEVSGDKSSGQKS